MNLGVLLEDPADGCVAPAFPPGSGVAGGRRGSGRAERALADDLAQKAHEMGAEKLFEYLEDTLSGAIRITDREEVLVEDFDRTLGPAVSEERPEQRAGVPHASAALFAARPRPESFSKIRRSQQEGWIETPEDLRLAPDMFVAEIAGHSMEPRIPDGSLCVFRYGVVGISQQGRLVLAEDLGRDRQQSLRREALPKQQDEYEDEWQHRRIAWNRSIPNIHPGISNPTKRNTASSPSSCACWISANPALRRQLAHHVRQDAAVAIILGFLRRIDPHDHFEGLLARVGDRPHARRARRTRRLAGCLRSNTSRSRSVPATRDSRPGRNCIGSTPIPTRFERWMRSKLSAITALHAQQQRALGGPVARRTRAVFLARDDQQRRAFLSDTSPTRRR